MGRSRVGAFVGLSLIVGAATVMVAPPPRTASAAPLPASPPPATAAPTPNIPATPQAPAPQFAPSGTAYLPLTPSRVLDTREGVGGTTLGPQSSFDLKVTGVGGVPASGVGAVVFNLTGVNATAGTFITQWPTGQNRPFAATLNLVPGEIAPNLVIAKVGSGGSVSLFNYAGNVDLVADVIGWFPPAADYTALTPSRILDTREGLGAPAAVGPRSSIDVKVTGVGGVPSAGVGAVVFNLTGVNATAGTFITQWPTGQDRPFTAALNLTPGEIAPNLVIAKVGAGGSVSLFNHAGTTDLVADVVGWFPNGSAYTPLTPARILDTREAFGAAGVVGPGESIDLQATGVGGVPTFGVGAVVFNLTGVNATAGTFITQWPAGESRPFTATLNLRRGEIAPNLVVAKVGAGGKVSLFNNTGSADLVADVVGWFPTGTTVASLPAAADVEWRLEPASVLLEPGATRKVNLVATNSVGVPLDVPAPTGITATVSRPGVSATYLGDGVVEIGAGADITTALVGVLPSGASAPAVTAVSIVRLQPGVQMIADALVQFPPPNWQPGDDLFVAGSGITADSIKGFTVPEIEARTLVPTNAGAGAGALLSPTAYYPLVLAGDPLAVGSLVIAGGGASVSGRVIELPGAPSLTRGGFSLVTVQSVPFEQLYLDVKYSVTRADFTSLGLSGTGTVTEGSTLVGPTVTGPAVDGEASGAELPARGGFGRSRPSTLPRPAAAADCKAGGASTELKLSFTPDLRPIVAGQIDVVAGVLQFVSVDLGAHAGVKLTALAKLQVALQFECEVPLGTLGQITLPFPGLLAPVLSGFIRLDAVGKFTVKVEGGPKLALGYTCQFGATINVGFQFTRVGDQMVYASRNAFDWDKPCENLSDIPNNLNDLSPASWDVSVSAGVDIPIGGKIGGAVSDILGYILRKSNIGDVTAVKFTLGPVFGFHGENVENMLQAKSGGSALTLAFKAAALVEIEGVGLIMRMFGNLEGKLEITLFETSTPLLTPFQVPNASGPLQYSINGDPYETLGEGEAIYVQHDDQLRVKAKLKTPPGVSLSDLPTVKVDTVYLEEASGGFTDQQSRFTGVSGATDEVVVQTTFSKEKCVEHQAGSGAGEGFAIGAEADMRIFGIALLPAPAWGGEFTVKCVDGKIKWEPEVRTIGATEAHVELKSTGRAKDSFTITGVPAWLTFPLLRGEWKRSPTEDETKTIRFHLTTQPTQCLDPRTATVIAKTEHRGEARITITEEDKCLLRFTTATTTASNGSATAHLETIGLQDDLYLSSESADWLTVNPLNGSLPATVGDEVDTLTFGFTIDERDQTCDDQEERRATVEVRTDTRGKTQIEVIDPAVPAGECYLEWEPKTTEGPVSATAKLLTEGITADTLEIDTSNLPSWITQVTPTDDVDLEVTDGEPQEITFVILMERRDAGCTRQGSRGANITVSTEHRGTAVLQIIDPPVPAITCETTSGGATGDPHMRSMDGVGFEGQILGEYVYGRAPNGEILPFELVVRTQPTAYGRTGSVAPTSVTAVSYTIDGHKVEGYRTLNDNGEVLIDGVLTPLTIGVAVEVSENLSVTRTAASRVRVDSSTLQLDLYFYYGGIIDLHVVAPVGTPMEGLLGSPDRNPANDFIGSTGTTYTINQVQQNQVPEFFDYVDSWRLQDQEDSPFTRSYPASEFNEANPGFDQELFDEWAPHVDAAVVGVEDICAGSPIDSIPTKYAIALELSLGRADVLGQYICSYAVNGVATSDDLPAAGLEITVDGPGLTPCVTRSGPDGRYLCILHPDLDEVRASPPTFPLQVSLTGRWPGVAGPVAAMGVAEYDARPGHNEGPLYRTVDLVVDPNSVPKLVVSGKITRDGQPVAGIQHFNLEAFDSSNVLVSRSAHQAVVDNTAGAYSFAKVLPPTAVRAVVSTTVIGPVNEGFDTEFTGLIAGADNRTWNIEFAVPSVVLGGTMTNGAGGGLPAMSVTVFSTNATGVALPAQSVVVTPSAADGSYGPIVVPLPRTAVSARASAAVQPYFELYEIGAEPVAPGPNPRTLSFDHKPPTLVVSGTVENADGSDVTGPVTLRLDFRNAAGNYLHTRTITVSPAAGTGHYEIPVTTLLSARKVTATIFVGPQADPYESLETSLVPGPNTMTFDVAHQILTLTVSGSMKKEDGSALEGQVPVVVTFVDANGTPLYAVTTNVAPTAGTGAYSFTVAGRRAAVRAVVRATAGVANETFTVDALNLAVGTPNVVTLDVQLASVVLAVSGSMTRVPGEGLVGPVNVRITFRNAASQGLNTVFRTVNPGPTGEYSYTAIGHRDATSALVEIYLGIHSDLESTVLTGLATGSNQRTHDFAFDPPILQLTGRMSGSDGLRVAPTVLVQFRALAATGVVTSNAFHTATLDADGDYQLDLQLSRAATSVQITPRVGVGTVDWEMTTVALAPGVNPTTLDVVYNPPRARVFGTMTDGLGTPLSGVQYLNWTAFDAAGAYLFGASTSVTPSNSPTGAYSIEVILPRRAARFEVFTPTGSYPDEWFTATATGFGTGSVIDVPLDVVYNPPRLHITGVAQVNGAPAPGSVYLRVVTHTSNPGPNATVETFRTVTADASGAFERTLTLHSRATSVEVYALAENGANEFGTDDDDAPLSAGELREIEISFDDHPSAVRLSGVLKPDGVPAEWAYLYMDVYDSAGTPINRDGAGYFPYFDTGFIDVDPDTGEYNHSFKLPDVAAQVVIYGWLDDEFGFHQVFAVDGTVDNHITFTVDRTVIRVTGTMLDHWGDPVEDLFEFIVDVVEHTPTGPVSGGSITGTYYPHDGPNGLDGEIEFEYVVQDETTTSVTFTVQEARLGYAVLEVDELQPGVNAESWIHEILDRKTVILDGTITDNGVPIADCVAADEDCVVLEFKFVDFSGDTNPTVPPYVVRIETGQIELDVIDGRWAISLGVPYDVNLGRIGVFPPGFDQGSEEPFTQSYMIGEGPDDYDAAPFDIELAATRITLDGLVSYNEPCTAGPFLVRVEIWGWDSQPADESGNPEDIPGGTLGGEYLVMPDEDGRFSLVTHLPPSTTWIRIYNDHSDFYPGWGGGGARGFGVPANAYLGTGLEISVGCPPVAG